MEMPGVSFPGYHGNGRKPARTGRLSTGGNRTGAYFFALDLPPAGLAGAFGSALPGAGLAGAAFGSGGFGRSMMVLTGFASATLKTRTVPSKLPIATSLLSGLKAAERSASPW